MKHNRINTALGGSRASMNLHGIANVLCKLLLNDMTLYQTLKQVSFKVERRVFNIFIIVVFFASYSYKL